MAETSENMIEMRGVCKGYDMGGARLEVLKNIDLTVKRGQFLAILGPSGSGKSTLMNLIGCMDRADQGEYMLDGSPIHTYKDDELTVIRNRKIGFVFQKYHLIPKYTVLQNVIMPLLLRGMSHRQAAADCAETIAMLGLSDRLTHRPNELSGGQQQRVAIARALVGHPAILLADEPTGALDSATGLEVLELFSKLNEMGNTIIMITHDLSVAAHAKRTVKIIDGELFE
ncbi:ABC transporter ATP-binding protein [Marasmitruncus massiliensis]|uniref:ABC transporter ATP-binding protein n=1 Tax=Marasmitruncus massiliensis TaxID=1944642 RepID=UPI000C7D41AC|nr:ABC transporter ATP-binding protein [Marasmitruncus massiliensis]